jgi:hypothetical protein
MELLVVIVVLVGLLLPAVQQAREAARAAQCRTAPSSAAESSPPARTRSTDEGKVSFPAQAAQAHRAREQDQGAEGGLV